MQEPNERFLHLKHISVIHYLPTLELPKSGSRVKASAYSQPAYASTPLFITLLLYTLILEIQVFDVIFILLHLSQSPFYTNTPNPLEFSADYDNPHTQVQIGQNNLLPIQSCPSMTTGNIL